MIRPSPSFHLRSWLRTTAFCFFFASITLPLHLTSADTTRTYIVHMDKSAMPTAIPDYHAWYTTTLSAAMEDHPRSGAPTDAITDQLPQLIYVYTHAIDGFSARLTPSQLERLKESHGFVSAHPDSPVQLGTTRTPDFLGLTDASGIWLESHHGEGAIIGVIDTGVWPESESFRDDGMPEVPSRWRGACVPGDNFTAAMCNRKLIGARYFNKGLLAENPNTTVSVSSARDTDGHGTHTASTVAGNFVKGASYFGYATGTARGVAPRAHLAIYKAFWDEGSSASDVLAAMDMAISDGVDVISLSLNNYDQTQLDHNLFAIGAFAAMENGIFVSTIAGNEGPAYKTITQAIPWALTVGASTIDRQFSGTVVLGDGTTINGGSLYIGKPSSTKQRPLVFNVDCDNETQLQENKRNIVVCEGLEENYVIDQEIGVREAKLAGAIFMSYAYFLERFINFEFPATFVDLEEGHRIKDYINKSTNPTASIHFGSTITGASPAPAVAGYSSRGPSLSCPDVLKPDLVAPGFLVLAAYPPSVVAPAARVNGVDKFSPFNIMSGTSMACPHAAGVAAMLKVLHPDWSPAAIRSSMMTTANPMDKGGRPITNLNDGDPANPLQMGSGQLDPNRALDPGLVYDAGFDDYLRFLCAMNYTREQIRTIVRSKPKVDCSGAPSLLDLNYPSFIGYFDPEDMSSSSGGKIVREFHRTVTNVADGAWTYTAKVTKMEGFAVSVKPHSLVFKQKHEQQSFTLRIVGHRKLSRFDVIHGSLSWVDDKGRHVVRSPIVATTHYLPEDD